MLGDSINYDQLLSEAPHGDMEDMIGFLSETLPYEWADVYRKAHPHQANIWRVLYNGFEYLYDISTELVQLGVVTEAEAVDDRLVAVHGRSRINQEKRKASIMRKHPLGPVGFIEYHSKVRYDRGHFIAHSLGGGLYINLFPQPTAVNRGWSESGKLFRAMERYCLKNPGTYCFSRPIYHGLSAHPCAIEYGVLKTDKTLWVNLFANSGDSEELEEIERLFRNRQL